MRRRLAVAIVGIATIALGVGVTGARPAHGATANRAAVVVEVNGVIHTVKVTFSSTSISGLDALRAAGFAPTVRVFGGNGGAVCALDVGGTTIGCPADTTCLTCSAASDYWAYWRALSGATKYTFSSVGASSTQVHDGDVEAWNWSTGAAPSPFVSFAAVWASPPVTTHPTATAPPTRGTSPATGAPVGPLGTTAPRSSDPSVTSNGPTTTAAAGSPTTASRATTSTRAGTTETSSVRAADDGGKDRKVATAPVVAHGGGGSPWGLIGFAALLVVLVGSILFARRRRRAAPA
jgi:hypothetical protein